jgi:proline iminopeptidase
MRDLHPPCEPDTVFRLAVGDGHELHVELSGNPAGRPVVILHGGPGSGLSASARRHFDPVRWRIVQFDQRNAGRSTPHASEPNVDLSTTTTPHMVADIERLRAHLGIARWTVAGGSWGATLALAYALAHPQRVSGMLLNSVATTTAREVDWITRGVGRFFPREWERFRSHVPAMLRDGDLADGYHRLLTDADPAVHHAAAEAWCTWEDAILSATPGYRSHPRWADPRFRLGFARLVTHVWRQRAWLADGAIERGVASLGGVPAILVHGRLDFGSPLDTAWRLHRAWPGSELTILETAGHDARDAGMTTAIMDAADALAEAGPEK